MTASERDLLTDTRDVTALLEGIVANHRASEVPTERKAFTPEEIMIIQAEHRISGLLVEIASVIADLTSGLYAPHLSYRVAYERLERLIRAERERLAIP